MGRAEARRGRWNVSNVLIGIIGVILFIGLALAGALILGDDFKSSSNETKATTVINTMSQISNAVNMRSLKMGEGIRTVPSAIDQSSTLIPRFLKSAPVSPLNRTSPYGLVEDTGGANGGYAAVVYLILGVGGDKTAQTICETIQRQTGQIAAEAPFDTTIRNLNVATLPSNVGCYWNSVNYTAFHKI